MSYDPKNHFWIVAGDEQRAYSSSAQAYVQISDADPERTTPIDSEASMIAVLRDNNVPPYHHVAKSVVISRLTDAQLEAAIGGMSVRQQERWRAPDSPYVYADDPEVIVIVQAVGANPALLLAPE